MIKVVNGKGELVEVWVETIEAAYLTGVTSSWLYELASEEKIKSKLEGNKRYFETNSLKEYSDSPPNIRGTRMAIFKDNFFQGMLMECEHVVPVEEWEAESEPLKEAL